MSADLNSTLTTGVVCRRNFSSYLVNLDGRILPCTASSQLNEVSPETEEQPLRDRRKADPAEKHPVPPALVVGDLVQIRIEGEEHGVILRVFPRRNKISRRPPGARRGTSREQILAANMDQVIAFCAVDHLPPEWHLLDRFLALAESSDLPASIFLSKSDLLPMSATKRETILREVEEYRRIGYPVVTCSGKTGMGIGEARRILRGKTSLLMGKSGVGKSSLLNALFPEWNLKVGEISRFGEGRCTTSNAELFPLETGGAVVDTPGMRVLDLWGMEGINPAHVFREMRCLEGECRFGLDCRHLDEPGCALRRAVEDGWISPRRFRSMLKIAEEIE